MQLQAGHGGPVQGAHACVDDKPHGRAAAIASAVAAMPRLAQPRTQAELQQLPEAVAQLGLGQPPKAPLERRSLASQLQQQVSRQQLQAARPHLPRHSSGADTSQVRTEPARFCLCHSLWTGVIGDVCTARCLAHRPDGS